MSGCDCSSCTFSTGQCEYGAWQDSKDFDFSAVGRGGGVSPANSARSADIFRDIPLHRPCPSCGGPVTVGTTARHNCGRSSSWQRQHNQPRGVQLTYPDTYYQRAPPASFIRIPGDDSFGRANGYFPRQGQLTLSTPGPMPSFDVRQQSNTSMQPTYLEMYDVYARPYY